MRLTAHGLEQRINRLRARLQMFGDMPDSTEMKTLDLRFFSLKQRLPGFGLQPEVGQVRVAEQWRRSGGAWHLVEYVYEYQRDESNPAGAGRLGYHCHALSEVDPSGRPVPHATVEDGGRNDRHHRYGVVDVDVAIDAFFALDASGRPISSVGLVPMFPGRRR